MEQSIQAVSSRKAVFDVFFFSEFKQFRGLAKHVSRYRLASACLLSLFMISFFFISIDLS